MLRFRTQSQTYFEITRKSLRHAVRFINQRKRGLMEATRITVDEVRERMDRGEQFTFVDSRNPQAWAESDEKLPNALRIPANELEQHLDKIPKDRAVITYCT